MTDLLHCEADAERLALIRAARAWLAGPLGQQMLEQERALLEQELARLFGGYLVHYGPSPERAAGCGQIQRRVHLGANLPGVEIVGDEQSWPISEHAADVVLLQHGLDFCLSPHGLLREAARCVRPGGHLIIVGINPWSAWGLRHWFARDAFRDAHCISVNRLGDWLNLLGFALEKRRFGCYRPPLSSAVWQSRLVRLEHWGERWQPFGAGFYLLVARKIVVGLRPLRQTQRAPMGKLVPMPVAKVSQRDSE
ncbi:methyltransferase domain-containing protein [Pseudomonas sp. UL073]|uniref:Methyltransferase domain-containing protein n=1 Tax=Zestomonas insulae TaxID=2809017 RepID=A0ABS2II98_9GAMM|nr:methyltransferase domain-containing protein [Pseudomonas insulae]MBM7062039.1 methyltransferase domain-containing protein [Pseudomonas insulae]